MAHFSWLNIEQIFLLQASFAVWDIVYLQLWKISSPHKIILTGMHWSTWLICDYRCALDFFFFFSFKIYKTMPAPEHLEMGTHISCAPEDTAKTPAQHGLVQENPRGYMHHQVLLLLSNIIILMINIHPHGTSDSTLNVTLIEKLCSFSKLEDDNSVS